MGSVPYLIVQGVHKGLTDPLVRFKTECTFTAEDPWNQNRRTTFTLDVYRFAAERPPAEIPDHTGP